MRSLPTLQGCYTQGDTYEKVLSNMEDAIRLHIKDHQGSSKFILPAEMVSLTTLEVRV